MKDTPGPDSFKTCFSIPYQLGPLLAANAVKDSCLVIDGLNCVMSKVDFLSGNHDIYSTLLSHDGDHRVLCTMSCPLPQKDNPEKALAALLSSMAGDGRFPVILLTGLPFLKLAGMDYEGLAAGIAGKSKVIDIPPVSLDADWLEGYELSLEALARALPERKARRKKRSVAVVGLLFDRNEGDQAGNISELGRLLRLCGLDPVCFFPSGGAFAELGRALEADVVVSLPYGRRAAAEIARRSGATLLETGLPLGLRGTSGWLAAVMAAAGLKPALPPAAAELERAAARAIAPLLEALQHRNAVFAGDPHLFEAFGAFARELRLRVPLALLDSAHRPLARETLPPRALFSPDTAEAKAAVLDLKDYDKADLLVGNAFARTEVFAKNTPFTEFGFPSYGYHCLNEEPFLGFAGARNLAGRLFSSLRATV